MSVIFDENIQNGQWPEEFKDAWIYIFSDSISSDTVMCLFKDNDFPEGTVIEGYNKSIAFPEAYVSWKTDGVCREIFVYPTHRRMGIGAALCAYARSYAYNSEGVVFRAPPAMSISAQGMLQNIENKYQEPYTNPEDFPPTVAYGYWGGIIL